MNRISDIARPAEAWDGAARLAMLCASWEAEPNGDETFPSARADALRRLGALRAFAAIQPGAATAALLDALRRIGGADLSLGRVFEGHVNAIQLVEAYGSDEQRARLAVDLADGKLFGVWATGDAPVTLRPQDGGWRLDGSKTFATGAGHLDRVLITAEDDGAKRLVLVDCAGASGRVDAGAWTMRGMRGTVSGRFDFTGLATPEIALIGGPEDYEREPRFSGGAWRFAAVQLGAIEALVRALRAHLVDAGKTGDPFQRQRFGQAVAAARTAGLWVARAAQRAEAEAEGAVAFVLMTRGIVEDAGLLVMEAAARSVGTRSFRTGDRVDRITRDLGLYLRQPVPDQARDRAAAAWLEADCWSDDPWW